MKCDIQNSGLEQLDLCSGKLKKLISPATGFPPSTQHETEVPQEERK